MIGIMDVYNHVTDREWIDKEIVKLDEVQVMYHEPCSFSQGCRRIGSKPSMIFREQAPKRQPDFVSAWLVACAEMV